MSQPDLFAAIPPPKPTYRLDQADAFEWLAKRPSNSVDLITTDIPYASVDLHRAKGTTTRMTESKASSNVFFPTLANAKLPLLLQEFYRILRPDRHCYLWLDETTSDIVKMQQFEAEPWQWKRNSDGSMPCRSGFKFWRTLDWVKTKRDSEDPAGGMGYHWRGAKESILFFEKGKRKLNKLGWSDVLMFPRPQVDHGTPKPWEANERLILNSTQSGEIVCDPFVGSGSAAVAALKAERSFVGCDIDPDTLDRAGAWLATIVPPESLPPAALEAAP